MKKNFLAIIYIIFFSTSANSDIKINPIYEGNIDAKVQLILYESLTCSHCADFHKNIYPDLKKNFIDKGLIKIEFRNFPLDMAALNASKIAHCKNDGNSDILHFLYKNQRKWVKGDTIEDANKNLKNLIINENFNIDFDSCINNKLVEDYILEDRINGVKKFEINATPTLVIDNKKLKDPFNYKKIKKTLQKLI